MSCRMSHAHYQPYKKQLNNLINSVQLISFRSQKNKELMNDIITNCKIKNGESSFSFGQIELVFRKGQRCVTRERLSSYVYLYLA